MDNRDNLYHNPRVFLFAATEEKTEFIFACACQRSLAFLAAMRARSWHCAALGFSNLRFQMPIILKWVYHLPSHGHGHYHCQLVHNKNPANFVEMMNALLVCDAILVWFFFILLDSASVVLTAVVACAIFVWFFDRKQDAMTLQVSNARSTLIHHAIW